MILSFYERKDSPWVWAQFRLKPTDKKRFEKTTVRKNEAKKRQKLARYYALLEERLLETADASGPGRPGVGWEWVPGWIRARYATRVRTSTVYLAHWRHLAQFMRASNIARPAELTREHCFEFVGWRCGQVKEKSGRSPKTNTAIGELKLLGLVMDEAKVRRLAHENPARRLGIEREDAMPKPEITDAELEVIFPALTESWMRRSFVLALQTGLRFADTRLHRGQVDWQNRMLHIENPKGGRKRAFSIPIYERIEPLLQEWWAGSEPWFWTAPEGVLTGIAWTRFFRRVGLPHLCFHCTRVTFISRAAQSGISEGMIMKLVNHASSEVHRVYQRLSPPNAARLVAGVSIPLPTDNHRSRKRR